MLLGLWGMESSFGDVIDNPKYMRPVIPALAALAWGEPRRRRYWEAELLNALTIVDRGWAQPSDMIGSWAGAMGHTQWMPEVWLHMGVDYDHDGRASPFGKPGRFIRRHRALFGRARELPARRSLGLRGQRSPQIMRSCANNRTMRSYAKWAELGVRACRRRSVRAPGGPGEALAAGRRRARLSWSGRIFARSIPITRRSSYTLALCHLGDLIRGDPPFRQQFPGGERAPTLEEVKEIQRRLNEHGFKTDGIDGRTGSDTIKAILAFQKKVGMEPADGYAGLKLLARLRQGS